jgi:hypothetical protein
MFIAVTLKSCPIRVSQGLPKMDSVLMQWTWEPIHLGKPRETLIGHDVSVTAMNMRSNPSWVNQLKFHVVYPDELALMFIVLTLMPCFFSVSRGLPRWIGYHVHCSSADVSQSIWVTLWNFNKTWLQCYCNEHESQSILGKPRETLIGHDVSVTAMNMRANPSWVNLVGYHVHCSKADVISY